MFSVEFGQVDLPILLFLCIVASAVTFLSNRTFSGWRANAKMDIKLYEAMARASRGLALKELHTLELIAAEGVR